MSDSDDAGDFAVVLSSELIAKIAQEHFDKVMFRQKVKIVDLKPANDGYMFSLVYMKAVEPVIAVTPLQSTPEEFDKSIQRLAQATMARASNGKFTKKERV